MGESPYLCTVKQIKRRKMKRIVFAIALFLSFGLGYANNNVRTIKAPRFARPLVEKWIEEYAKTEPGVEFQIVKGQTESDLSVTIADQQEAVTDNILERRPCCLLLRAVQRQHGCWRENI